jgi:hypothetical protein
VPAHLIGNSCVGDALGRYMFSEARALSVKYTYSR